MTNCWRSDERKRVDDRGETMSGKSAKSPLLRFSESVRVVSSDPASCWEWIGERDRGYGKFWDGSRRVRAHRFAWEMIHGPVPSGMVIRHACDNRACVRLSHLEIGTRADNNRDMAVRRRGHKSQYGLPYGVVVRDNGWAANVWDGGVIKY